MGRTVATAKTYLIGVGSIGLTEPVNKASTSTTKMRVPCAMCLVDFPLGGNWTTEKVHQKDIATNITYIVWYLHIRFSI